jgi:hypothetical protein
VWFLAGLGYFAFYARKHIVHSPEEAFAVAQIAQHADQPPPPAP